MDGVKVVSLDARFSTGRVAKNLVEAVPLHNVNSVDTVCDNPETASGRETPRMGNPEEVSTWGYVPDAAKVLGCERYGVVTNSKDLRKVEDENHITASQSVCQRFPDWTMEGF
jgi:hypothetical protein